MFEALLKRVDTQLIIYNKQELKIYNFYLFFLFVTQNLQVYITQFSNVKKDKKNLIL